MTDDLDLAIIGSGGAAFAAGIRASALGASSVVIERGAIGGTCMNVGCVPSKTLLAAADDFYRAASPRFDGVPTSAGEADLRALVAQKDQLVADLRQAKYLDLAREYGFEILPGDASFADQDTLRVDGRSLRARAYLVATGAEPAVPDIPGLREAGYLTSTTAMVLDEVPRRLVTIGGGFVGMEQGQLFSRLGAEVTVVGRLAPRAEPELSDWMARAFADEGIGLVPERVVRVERDDGTTAVVTDGGTRIETDAILVAVGRSPRVADLDVEAAGIGLDEGSSPSMTSSGRPIPVSSRPAMSPAAPSSSTPPPPRAPWRPPTP